MKAKDLIALLANANPEDDVCVFTEYGPEEVTRADVYVGFYNKDMAPKLTSQRIDNARFVGLGNPGDFDVTESHEDCALVYDLQRKEAYN